MKARDIAAAPDLAAAAVGVGVAACLLLPPAGAALALGVFGLAAAFVLLAAARAGLRRFGLANRITLFRLGGASTLAGFVTVPEALAGPGGWAAAGAAGLLLSLDGIDGRIARRQGLATRFGARFDMETDALTIVVLAALALGLGKAGPWVLALGGMRYAFLLAGRIEPRLARPLGESVRRKAVCVAQIAVLTLLLVPPVGPPLSGWLAAAALAALVWSFGRDVRTLLGAAS